MQAERERLAARDPRHPRPGLHQYRHALRAAESELARDPAAAAGTARPGGATARENLAEARALVAALTPADLQRAPLGEALRRLADRFAARPACGHGSTSTGDAGALPAGGRGRAAALRAGGAGQRPQARRRRAGRRSTLAYDGPTVRARRCATTASASTRRAARRLRPRRHARPGRSEVGGDVQVAQRARRAARPSRVGGAGA